METESRLSRRELLRVAAGAVGLVGLGGLSGCTSPQPAPAAPSKSAAEAGAPGQTTAKAPEKAAAAAPKTGGVLRYGASDDIFGFDPTQLPGGNYPVLCNVFDTLIRYDKDFKPVPQLAESWGFEDGGKRLVMKLRKGVTFHSGRDFTAEDVVYTLKRFQDKDVAAGVRGLALFVKDVKADDKHTAIFMMDPPNAVILDLLDLMFVMDRDVEKDIKTKGSGTGPFKMKSWVPGDKAVFEKNRSYWKEGRPYLDGVEIMAVPDRNALSVHVESGSIDVAEGLPPTELKRLESNREIEIVIEGKGANTSALVFNITRPPFDNPKVRAAVDLAINRERFAQNYWAGLGQVCRLPYARHSPGYFQDQDKWEFNLDKARDLLREAGITSADAVATSSAGAYQPGSEVMAEILQADLAKIGINLKLEDLPQAQARPKFANREYQLACYSYGRSSRDPVTLMNGAAPWRTDCPANITGYCSEKYNKLVESAATTIDPEKRKPILRELNELVVAERFCVPITLGFRGFPKRRRVQGFAANLDGMAVLEDTWLA